MASKSAVSVEIYTGSHRVLGRISPGPAGLFSFLNIPTRSTIEIDGAHMTRLHQPARLVARHARLWLMKQEIAALLLSSRAELGSPSIVRGGYSTLAPHRVHVMLAGYELRGTLETPGKFDFDTLMIQGDSTFFPMYDGDLKAILFPNIEAASPVLLFNRDMVSAMALLPKEDVG